MITFIVTSFTGQLGFGVLVVKPVGIRGAFSICNVMRLIIYYTKL